MNKPSKKGDKKRFFVLYCDGDDSHILVEESCVICTPSVAVGHKVLVKYPGLKESLTSEVKGISMDYNEMAKLQNHLNSATKPRREPSFHEGQKRAAALKCMNSLSRPGSSASASALVQALKSKSVASKDTSAMCGPINKPDESKGNKGNKRVAVISSDDEEDDDEDLSPEEQRLIEKLKRRKRSADIKKLLQLQDKPKKPTATPATMDESSTEESQSNPSLVHHRGHILLEDNTTKTDYDIYLSSADDLSNADDDLSNTDEDKTPTTKAGARKKKQRPTLREKPPRQITFNGEHFQWTAADSKVEKLHSKYDVYIKSNDLREVKCRCNTASATSRALVRKIFTAEARAVCSAAGKPSSGKSGAVEIRSALDPEGINAILAFVRKRGEAKGWPIVGSTLKMAIGNMLCEERMALRLKGELLQNAVLE